MAYDDIDFTHIPFFVGGKKEEMPLACVLDMDETLGFSDKNQFRVRPHLDTLIRFLRLCKIRTYIWSLGRDDYVKKVVNTYMPKMKNFAFKIYGRKECEVANRLHGWNKASKHIRDECSEHLILIGVDDRVEENMDNGYDLKIAIVPYDSVNPNDTALVSVIDEIMLFLMRNDIKIDYYSNIKTAFKDEDDDDGN